MYIPTSILTLHLFPQVSGGIYVPLLSSAIYLTAGFQQYFQKKHKFRSLLKNLFSVIGTSLLTGTIRELLGSGSFAGIPLHFNPPLPILLQPAGGLILLVLMLILFKNTGRREAKYADSK